MGIEPKGENERLATLEEQVKGMRHDFGGLREEMKNTMVTFLQLVKDMQHDYLPRAEFEREMQHRDTKERDRMERVGTLENEVEKLQGRPTWTVAGLFVGSATIITILISIIALNLGK